MVGPNSSGRAESLGLMVGRELEVAAISEAIERTQDGSGQVVVLTGPVGMGKSRLVEKAVRLAEDLSFGILRGVGSLIDLSRAYAPVLHGVGQLLNEMAPPKRAKLVRGLDSLGLVLEGLDLPTPMPLGDPSLERTRLFESMVRLIDRLAEEHPLMLAFDDAQWIDDASLEFLSYLVMDLPSLNVLLLVSIDSYETSPQAERLLAQLRRTAACTDLSLNPLEAAQVGLLAEQVLDAPVRPRDAEALAQVSGGNPLLTLAYIDEMVLHGDMERVEGRWAITTDPLETLPSAAREAYEARISRLDDRTRSVLEIIAIGGGEVSNDHLLAVSELQDAELAGPVRHLESTGMVGTESQTDEVSLRCFHPVISRVVYERVAITQRQRIHARFIEVLEKEPVDPGTLVWHYLHVGGQVDQDRRLEVLAGAGRRALAKYANEDAVQILGKALEVARSSGSPPDISGLLEDFGDALQRSGDELAAIEMWKEASSLSQHTNVQVRLARRMAATESNLGRFSEARRYVDGGMATLADDKSPEAVELRAVGILTSFRAGDITEAEAGIEFLTGLASRQPSARTMLNLAMLRAGLALEQTSYEEARVQARAAYDMARSVDDRVAEQQALAFLALVDLSLGDLADLTGHLDANLELTERIGIRLRAYRVLLYQFAGDIYGGRWEHAGDVALEAALLAQGIEDSRNRVVLVAMPALLDIHRGEFAQVASRLDQARQALNELGHADPRLHVIIDVLEAWSALESGNPEQAVATLDGPDSDFLHGLLPPWGIMILSEAQARIGDQKWARTADGLAAMGKPGCLPWVWSRRVEAMAASDPAVAIRGWEEAARGFNDLGMPFEAARTRLQAAELGVPLGSQVGEDLKEDHRLFASLGATRYRDRARRLLRSLGEPTAAAAPREPGVLSPRQTEVARLVAEGLTNGEISDRLFISRRTVTTHLENIYRQLGIGSRTALTRYVLEETR